MDPPCRALALVVLAACGGPEAGTDAAAVDARDTDAAAIDAQPPPACVVEATFELTGGLSADQASAVDTGLGWVIAHRGFTQESEVWVTAVAYDGAITAPARRVGPGDAPRLAVNRDRVLLVYGSPTGNVAQPLTTAGADAGPPVEVPARLVAGIVAGPADGFRVIDYVPIPPPTEPVGHSTSCTASLVHLDRNGGVLGTGVRVLIGAPELGVVHGRSDGGIVLGTRVRYVLPRVEAETAGLAEVTSADVWIDHGMAPPDPFLPSVVTSFAELGGRIYVDDQITTIPTIRPGHVRIARFPHAPVATLPADHSLVVGLDATTGALATSEPGGHRLRSFTDTGTFALGPACALDLEPAALVRRDADSVLVLGAGPARVVTVPL